MFNHNCGNAQFDPCNIDKFGLSSIGIGRKEKDHNPAAFEEQSHRQRMLGSSYASSVKHEPFDPIMQCLIHAN